MSKVNAALTALQTWVNGRLAAVAPFRATVDSLSAGKVAILRPTAATAETELYGRLAGLALEADDEVVCLIVAGKPVVLGKLQYAAPGTQTFDTIVFVHKTSASAFVVEDDAGANALQVDTSNNLVRIAGLLDHDGTGIGFFGTTPVSQQPANADTSGATLAALETEVNQVKQLLRNYGLMA